MCCLFAHHSIPSFNLTGSSFCAYKYVFVCVRARSCLPAPLFLSLCTSLAYITAFSASVLHFRCAQKQRVFFLCMVCFAFLFLPLLLLSLSLSSLFLISGLKSLDFLLHPQKHTLTEWKSCNNQPKPTFCSPLCCYFVLQSVSLSLSRPIFFSSQLCLFLSFSITLSCPLITVPMFSLIIFIYSLPPLSTHSCLQGRLALDVDLRRTDIQRPVPCLQHWHFCQTLMVPLNRDVWREELPVSLPSSSSNSASPPLGVRCTVAACSPITRTYTQTEPCAQPRSHSVPNFCTWICARACKKHMRTIAQLLLECLQSLIAPPLIKLAPGERQRWPGYLSHLFPLLSCQPPSCCGAFKDTHATAVTLELRSCFSFPMPSNLF